MMILSEMAETDSRGHAETNGDIMERIRRRRGETARPASWASRQKTASVSLRRGANTKAIPYRREDVNTLLLKTIQCFRDFNSN